VRDEQLREMRQRAELAVAEMPDGDLKTKAFEVILSHLLTSSDGEANQPKKVTAREATGEEPKPSPSSASARILALRDGGFFSTQRTIGDIKKELATHGWHYPLSNLSGKLQSLVRERQLRRMKVNEGSRSLWKYSPP
jgi:hypothetical protein